MDCTLTCPCGCGQHVSGHDAGFQATTVTVDACETRRAQGIRSVEMRKTAALALLVPATMTVRHSAGLVTFEVAA